MPGYNQNFIFPCPVKGVDTTSNKGAMDIQTCLRADNFVINNGYLETRKGQKITHKLKNDNSIINSLMVYSKKEKVGDDINIYEEMFIATSKGLYKTKTLGIGRVEEIEDNLLKDFTDYNYGDGNYVSCLFKTRLFMCNGVGDTLIYDGEKIRKLYTKQEYDTLTGDKAKEYYLEDLDREQDVGVIKGRGTKFYIVASGGGSLLFNYKGDLGFYYLGLGLLKGKVDYFDLSQIAKKGGHLVAITQFGNNDESGFNDNIAFITSKGEIIVYRVRNFGKADGIQLVGIFNTAIPSGKHCCITWGADIILITENGYKSLKNIVNQGELTKANTLFSDRIANYIKSATGQSSLVGDSVNGIVYPQENFALFSNTFTFPEQHIMNLENGGWTRFTDIVGYCWGIFNGKLYFGSKNGYVKSYEGLYDEVYLEPSGKAKKLSVKTDLQLCWTNFNSNENKRAIFLIPQIESSFPDLQVAFSVNTDFITDLLISKNSGEVKGFYWGYSKREIDIDKTLKNNLINNRLWNTELWYGKALLKFKKVYNVSGFGKFFSIRYKFEGGGLKLKYYNTLLEFEESKGVV